MEFQKSWFGSWVGIYLYGYFISYFGVIISDYVRAFTQNLIQEERKAGVTDLERDKECREICGGGCWSLVLDWRGIVEARLGRSRYDYLGIDLAV